MIQGTTIKLAEGSLQSVYDGILQACQEVALHMRYRLSNKIDNVNDCGDVQLDMDV